MPCVLLQIELDKRLNMGDLTWLFSGISQNELYVLITPDPNKFNSSQKFLHANSIPPKPVEKSTFVCFRINYPQFNLSHKTRIWSAYHALTNQPRDPHLASHWWWHVFRWVLIYSDNKIMISLSWFWIGLIMLSDSWKGQYLLAPFPLHTPYHFLFVLGQWSPSVMIWIFLLLWVMS